MASTKIHSGNRLAAQFPPRYCPVKASISADMESGLKLDVRWEMKVGANRLLGRDISKIPSCIQRVEIGGLVEKEKEIDRCN